MLIIPELKKQKLTSCIANLGHRASILSQKAGNTKVAKNIDVNSSEKVAL